MVRHYIREALPTSLIFATMRLLACMCANVYGQCASLYKALDTAQMNAAIWSFIRMYPVMSLEVRLAVETLLWLQSAFCQLDFWRAKKEADAQNSLYLWTTLWPRTCKWSNNRKASRRFPIRNRCHICPNFSAIIGLAMAKIGTGEDVFWRAERGGGFFLFFIFCFLFIFPFG